MIISASRRCDIPAFQGEWFMESLNCGAVDVANPFCPGRSRRISLKREDVDAFVFWSRDPRPFLKHLPEIERRGFPFCFLITTTGYPRSLEPAVPDMDEALQFYSELAARSGRHRVAWRYDPVLFTPLTGSAFQAENFSRLAVRLAPYASRVIVSFFDPYAKAQRRLRRAGIDPDTAAGTPEQQAELLGHLARIAAREGLAIQSCAEPASGISVRPGKCIDEKWLNDLFGLGLPYRKDPAQRPSCLCQLSADIGAYGSCRHGCLYCYAR